MEIRKINDGLSVSPQIEAANVPDIARLGFKSLVCNRPDGEAAGQPLYDDIEAAARAEGLEVVYQPVASGMVSDENAGDFGKILAGLPGPVLAYCRSGTRCTILWALSEAADAKPVPEIVRQAASAGYDLSGLVERLVALQPR